MAVSRCIFDKGCLIFSALAIVTFGGAYAVLGYLGQTAVGDLGWNTAPQIVDTLGLAEATLSPLILMTKFIEFLTDNK